MTLKELKDAVNYFDSAYDDMTVLVGDGYDCYIETPESLKMNVQRGQLEMRVDVIEDV